MKKKKRKKNNNLLSFFVAFFCVLILGGLILLLIYNKQNSYMNVVDEEVHSEETVENTENSAGEEDVIELPAEVQGESEEASVVPEEKSSEEDIIEELPENTYRVSNSHDGKARFTFAGDVLLDDNYATMSVFRNNGSNVEKIFTNGLLEDMRDADVFMINNEFTYTTNGAPRPEKIFTFRAKPENVSILQDIGVDIVSAANNHISDYGLISTTDTLDTLSGAGIPYVGAGYNSDDASKVVYYQTDDTKVGIVCATQIERYENPDTPEATKDSAGTFRCLHPEGLVDKIKEAKANCDVVVLYIHWGAENEVPIHWSQSGQVSEYTQAGADVIIGGHPHVLQGIGYDENIPVFYSLGNFWFASKMTDTCIVNMDVSGGEIQSLQFVPCVSQSCIVRKCDGEEKKRILDYMRSLSPGVSIDEDGFVTQN